MRLLLPRLGWIALCACFAAQAGPLATAASAQYFGRNKVRYRTFDFKILKTGHFDVYYYDAEREAAEQAARMAERWYARLSRVLDHELNGRQPLILYASHPDFEQTNTIEGELGEGTGGVTEISKRRIVLPLAASLAETDHVLGHELVHAFQFDLLRQDHPGTGAVALPLWFVEGMAEYLSIGPVDPNTAMWMRDAAEHERLPSISKLSSPRYFPYRYGQALWAYVAGRWGDEAVGRILKLVGRTANAEAAIQSVTGVRADSLSRQWHDAIRAWYAPVASATSPPERFGRAIVTERRGRGRINVAPALSPDGSRLVFLSERDLFSIEAFLADAGTGRVIRRLTRTAVDPHLQSLQFIQSAGAWSPDGRRFAFAAVSEGQPVLSVIDAGSGRTARQIRFADFGEIFNPSWSPDGNQIALSAMAGGASDLIIVDLASGKSRRLTHDLYADLEPAWSPDGKQIAFVTDRFDTRLADLAYGRERLALIDPASGTIQPAPGFEDAKNINPQWSPDGRSLFFISDHGGISDVYRAALDDGTIRRVTNVRAGVSGITRLSPALSVARAADRMVFSAYTGGSYALYAVDSSAVLAGRAPVPPPRGAQPAEIPPTDRNPSEIASLVRDHKLGLEHAENPKRAPYRAGLSLDHVAQTSLGVAAGSNGVAVGGGTTLYWSDMLGDHNLATLLQLSNYGGSFTNNVAAIVAYENRRSRWNWGLAAGQIPYLNRTIAVDRGTLNGVPATRVRDDRFWEIDRQAELAVSYPFSRVQRVELGTGYIHIGYQNERVTRIYSDLTGELLRDETVTSDTLPSLDMATTRAALVYDNSIFGGTSPILGQRYRLEVAPAFGSLHFVGALADYRRYLMLKRPLNLAGRLLHFGRYGRDGEDARLGALFVGYPWLVRGYDAESFTNDPSNPNGPSVLDRLFGSRLGVANLELRVPLLGPAGLVRSPFVPPIEAAGFFDAGVAWTESEKPSFFGGPRKPVTSRGVALRVNLFGIAIGEVDYVHPDDRPQKGWYWLFSLQPGF